MMYEKLAEFYDALVKDEEATKAWVDLIESYLPKGKINGTGLWQRRNHELHFAKDG